MNQEEIEKILEENNTLKNKLETLDKKPPYLKSYNEKLLIGLVVGAIAGFGIYFGLETIANYPQKIYLIFISVFFTIILIFLLTVWFRKRIVRKFFGRDIDFESIKKDSQQTISIVSEKIVEYLPVEQQNKNNIKQFAPKLISFLLWSNYRNWVLGIMLTFITGCGGLVVTILTLNQNKLFKNQNQLLKTQNSKIEQQTQLAEASRRSSQMFIMGEVLSDVNKELREIQQHQNELQKQNQDITLKRVLSNTLVGRIISLSRAMKPYKYLQTDTTSNQNSFNLTKLISPERGQLLITLVNSNIDSIFFNRKILGTKRADFSYAELYNANLVYANFRNINLKNADLSLSNLSNANLSYADLQNANLQNSYSEGTNFKSTNLQNANFINSFFMNVRLEKTNLQNADLGGAIFSSKITLKEVDLSYANFERADLNEITFKNVIFKRTNFQGAHLDYSNFENEKLNVLEMNQTHLEYANLKNSELKLTNLTRANLHKTNFTNANLAHANLSYTNLQGANLSFTKLEGTNLSNVISLDSVKVHRKDWLYYIDSLKLKGSQKIIDSYKVVPYDNKLNTFILKKKHD